MRSRIWQGSSVVVLSWLLLACSSSKNAAPVDGVDEGQFVSTIPARQSGAQVSAPIQGGSYVVKRGDTLYSIAFNSGNDVPSLASLNNISPPYNIYPGQRLRLDGSSASVGSSRSAGTYEVRRGDTLSSIGRQFGMTPQALAQSNNLSAPLCAATGSGAQCPDRRRRFDPDGGCDSSGNRDAGGREPSQQRSASVGRAERIWSDHTVHLSEIRCSGSTEGIRSVQRTKNKQLPVETCLALARKRPDCRGVLCCRTG